MEKKNIPMIERYRGCLLGLAAGDALGTALEFKAPGTFNPISDMVGGGPFHLKPGEWTDDTAMALCLAESLIACRGFNPHDQMERYVRWWRKGHLSSTGACFDIGNTTRAALERFEATGNPFSGSSDFNQSGNGSLMRLAPVPLFYEEYPEEAIEKCGESSKTTHASTIALDACRYFGGLIIGALRGESKETLLSAFYSPAPGSWTASPPHRVIATIAAGSFKNADPPEIRGTGFVADSLEAALWAFHNSKTFAKGCLMAVNLGDDADTTGAIYGQLAGAYYGQEAIPLSWTDKLAKRDLIVQMAEGLMG